MMNPRRLDDDGGYAGGHQKYPKPLKEDVCM
jgi:hypothetical protein